MKNGTDAVHRAVANQKMAAMVFIVQKANKKIAPMQKLLQK